MNLFDLAHHPYAYANRDRTGDYLLSPYNPNTSTEEQFNLMQDVIELHADNVLNFIGNSLKQHEYRMFLLFIYWSTES